MNNQQESLGWTEKIERDFQAFILSMNSYGEKISLRCSQQILSYFFQVILQGGVNKALASQRASDREQIVGEIVICAAVLTTEGEVIRGHRHSNCIHMILDMGGAPVATPEAQGFITSRNRYVTREEGRKLQDAAGIKSVAKDGYVGNMLFSEDLY